MSAVIDKFTKQFHDDVEAVEERAKSLKKTIRSATKKTQEVKSNIEEWGTNREVKKLEDRADKSEDYAATAIAIAMLSMEEAEAATLEAICDRLDAETAAETTHKK